MSGETNHSRSVTWEPGALSYISFLFGDMLLSIFFVYKLSDHLITHVSPENLFFAFFWIFIGLGAAFLLRRTGASLIVISLRAGLFCLMGLVMLIIPIKWFAIFPFILLAPMWITRIRNRDKTKST